MHQGTAPDAAATLAVENIGGIDAATAELHPGVTVLAGRNATNRTSFLKAMMAALGSDWTAVKGDAKHGHVSLTLGEETYERQITRTEDGIVSSGNGLLADPTLANLFAFLLEDNEARQAVVRGDDLRDIIMRPVDTSELRRDIHDAEERKADIDAELDAIAELKQELPALEQRRAATQSEIADVREELAAVEDRLDERDLTVDLTQSNTDALETRLDELRATREELRRVRADITSEQESLSALREERGRLAAELAGLPDAPADRLEELEHRLSARRERKRELSTYTSRLQTIIGFNEEFIDGEHDRIADALGRKPESVGDITDQLYRGSKTTCWTCGSTVKPARFESTLDSLRQHRQETFEEIDELDAEISELTEEKARITETVDRRRELADTIDEVDAEIESRQGTLSNLRERRDNLSARVADLEAEVTELRSAEVDEVLDLHSEANELEFELESLESTLEDIEEEIAEAEAEIRRDEQLVARRESVVEELIDLRTRIDTLETEATTAFNERMADLLDILDYENVERIWLERLDGPADSVATVDAESVIEGSEFELHVVRSTDGGTVYEDTVAHLSESERAVTGLVFALAGYLVHDVAEQVPFMLLDSLEAIDAERIADLVEYFATEVPYLVVALLPEDAEALPERYDRVRNIGQSQSQ
ncbi:archaea-specific SMC-related protein [Haloarcula onubensis]|uniref:Chromosome segregation protein SMC n=1 Tax=Haloarcula onubensis TaxID=2950539 RepID=A0ABU2FWI8_9EURY|nr:archaea-specific SMC-related protein [Halomicroarcula sp. S3CR25-11]MDS0284642.1 chromosome segregation protein SMC [Halomicroarcula sp. S3CR25-11]